MHQEIYQHTFANGLTLLAERMPHVRSAAFSLSVRAGCAYDPPEHLGLAGILSELIMRGAGSRDNRELTLALDGLGVDRSESVGLIQMYFGGATLARNLGPALELYADILRRPHLPEEELEAARSLALQELQGLEDDPQSKVMVELRKRHYPAPLNRDQRGDEAGVSALTINALRSFYQRYFQPAEMIVSVAGDIDWPKLRDLIERLYGDWRPQAVAMPFVGPDGPSSEHMTKDLDQTQIGIAYRSVPINDPGYYAARGAVGVLSGGMSARLFTEVREKYGLCYAIHASHETMKDRANVICFTAGKPERAQELLERTLHELKRLKDGIEGEEVARVQAGLKSSLIMRQESTGARASQMASDWYLLGRVRSVEEIQAAIDGLSPESIVAHLRLCPPKDFTIVTLGPKELAHSHSD
ncbi:MAG TPA: pitrilysin family protein [Gemmataceae bacterium]|nr:pitrilysin family protein [Gemmataceae bacterium]